jgi:hypothetical protein
MTKQPNSKVSKELEKVERFASCRNMRAPAHDGEWTTATSDKNTP